MAYDLPTARVRIGFPATDPTRDVELRAAMSSALSIAESYCDRKFEFQRELLTKTIDRGYDGAFVDRYPIRKVHSVTGAPGSSVSSRTYSQHNDAGIVFFENGRSRETRQVQIDYEGGYRSLPKDLEYAMWSIFDSLWPTFDPTGGVGGGTTVAIGAVKKRTIVGVGSIEYETGGGSASSGSGSVAADWSAVMPGATKAILDLYSRKVA